MSLCVRRLVNTCSILYIYLLLDIMKAFAVLVGYVHIVSSVQTVVNQELKWYVYVTVQMESLHINFI